MIIQISLKHFTVYVICLLVSCYIRRINHLKKSENFAYIKQSDAGVFEVLDDSAFNRIRNSAFSDQCKSRVPGFCTGFHHKFSDVPCSADDQDFAFLRHSANFFVVAQSKVGMREVYNEKLVWFGSSWFDVTRI